MNPYVSVRQNRRPIGSSLPSSGPISAGYHPIAVFRWLGEKGLNAADEIFIYTTYRRALQLLDAWKRAANGHASEKFFEIGTERYDSLYNILRDALEMSRLVQ
jgi:hypothetical protein